MRIEIEIRAVQLAALRQAGAKFRSASSANFCLEIIKLGEILLVE